MVGDPSVGVVLMSTPSIVRILIVRNLFSGSADPAAVDAVAPQAAAGRRTEQSVTRWTW
jgi:hypothetical protein